MKKYQSIKASIVSLLVFCFVLAPLRFSNLPQKSSSASANTASTIDTDTTWIAGEHLIDRWINVKNGATLTIKKGAIIKFAGSVDLSVGIKVTNGAIVAEGTESEKVTFTTVSEESRYGIYFRNNDNDKVSLFKYTEFLNGGYIAYPMLYNDKQYLQTAWAYGSPKATFEYSSGKVHIENSAFRNSYNQDIEGYKSIWAATDNDYFEIANSDFEGGQSDIAAETYVYCSSGAGQCPKKNEKIKFTNNWYGDSAGPSIAPDFSGNGKKLIGEYTLECWRSASILDPTSSVTCPNSNSNVLFLPGIEASRLYMNDGSGEDQLWEPNFFGNDIEDLMMNENGESNNSVYTKEVIDEVGDIWAGGNIYKSFENKLKELKGNGTINGYDMFAYDWRKNVEDVATEDTAYFPGIMKNVLSTTKLLADSSKSKKVTIVAHSNGGLVAKAIMQELEREGKTDMVDKIVLVASPQMGTPLSILSMLYGYDQSLLWGTLMNKSEARKLAENMPAVYGLLPSKTYFDRMQEPFIKFSSENTRYLQFKEKYGGEINDWNELEDFLAARLDNREKPDEDETEIENVLNSKLLQQAEEIHQRLDNWTIPSNVEVIEIAGWGLDTVSGVEYTEKKKTKCLIPASAIVPVCWKSDELEPYYEPKWTVDGDKVVVASSALMLPGADNVKKYWVDLWSYNDDNPDIKHKNILEAIPIENFIFNIITNNTETALPEYISTSRPNDYEGAKPRLHMSLYSPLDIHLTANGKHTGPITVEENGQQFKTFEEQISNSYYYQFGDRKYVGIPVGENVQVRMDGYGSGSYTLKIEEVKETENGEEVVVQTTFANLAVSPATKVSLDIPESGLENMPNLKADYDGDGENDYEAAVVLGGEAQIIDNVKPTIEITSPEAKEYLNNQTIDLAYSVIDNLSPQSEVVVQIYLNGEQINEKKIDLSMLSLGDHTIKIVATDKTGNTQEKEVSFLITTSIEAIKDNVQKYYDAKFIKSKQQKNVLQVSLEIIEQRLAFLEMIRKNPYISKKAKSIIEKIVREQIENHIEFLIKQINNKQKYYDAKVKALLIEDLQWLETNAVK